MQLPVDGFLRTRQVLEVVPVGRSTLLDRRWRERNHFPSPRKISEFITGWSVAEIRQWLESRGLSSGEPAHLKGEKEAA